MAPPVLLALALLCIAGSTIAAETPRAPKLQDLEGATPPPDGTSGEPARALPATVTICRDVKRERCWSEPGDSDCNSTGYPDARPFRTLASDASEGDPGTALKACWDTLSR